MDRLEKLIYSVKYLPQLLYFGSAGLIILCLFLNVEPFGNKLIIALYIFFFYMTYLASKNYKKKDTSSGKTGLEKLIYSTKYLPPILYFGSVAWLAYTYYYGAYLDNEIQILGYAWDNSVLSDIFLIWFFYITYLGLKNLKSKS